MDRCASLCFCYAEFQIASAFSNCIVKYTIQSIAVLFHWPHQNTDPVLRSPESHISVEEILSSAT